MYDNGQDCPVPGLHSAGEAASNCHGANRLGANSILDIVVFGRGIGINVSKISKPGDKLPQLKDVSFHLNYRINVVIFNISV